MQQADSKPQEPNLEPQLDEKELASYFENLDKNALALEAQSIKEEYHRILRRLILKEDRVDLLATEILGYEIKGSPYKNHRSTK